MRKFQGKRAQNRDVNLRPKTVEFSWVHNEEKGSEQFETHRTLMARGSDENSK